MLRHPTRFFKLEKCEPRLNDPTANTQRLFTWIIPHPNRELHRHSELCSVLHTPSGSEVRTCVCVCADRWFYQRQRLHCYHSYIYNTPPLSLWPHAEWLPCVHVCLFVNVCMSAMSGDVCKSVWRVQCSPKICNEITFLWQEFATVEKHLDPKLVGIPSNEHTQSLCSEHSSHFHSPADFPPENHPCWDVRALSISGRLEQITHLVAQTHPPRLGWEESQSF